MGWRVRREKDEQQRGCLRTLLKAKIKEAQCSMDGKCTLNLLDEDPTGYWEMELGLWVPVKCSWEETCTVIAAAGQKPHGS